MDIFEFIEEVENNSKINIPKLEGDYIKDGLLYCGKCNTPKQGRYSLGYRVVTPYILCKCESEKYKAEQEAEKQRRKAERIERRRNEAFPDCQGSLEDMRKWTFDKDDNAIPMLSQVGKRYVENFETFMQQGKGLLIYGTVGTGKTFISACIANALIDAGYKVLMTSFSRIENTVFPLEDKQKYYDNLNNYDLLILDDFGVERTSEYKQEIIYTVIDSRCKANLPLIVTSNIGSEELKNPKNATEQRVFSRLFKMCHPVKVDSKDRRRKELANSFAEIQRLLGV